MGLKLFGGTKKNKQHKSNTKPMKNGKKKGSLFGLGGKKSNKNNFIQQLHLQPVVEDALIDEIQKDIKNPDQHFVKVDNEYGLIYLLGLTNDLIESSELANNMGDLKSALNLSDSDGDVPGSIFNASFDTDLDPDPDPETGEDQPQQIVFLPTQYTLETLGTITSADQQYEITTIPADLSAETLDNYYQSGDINAPLSDDNGQTLTKTLRDFEQFVDERIAPDDQDADASQDANDDYDDQNYDDQDQNYDDQNYDESEPTDDDDYGEDEYNDQNDDYEDDPLASSDDQAGDYEDTDNDDNNQDFGLGGLDTTDNQQDDTQGLDSLPDDNSNDDSTNDDLDTLPDNSENNDNDLSSLSDDDTNSSDNLPDNSNDDDILGLNDDSQSNDNSNDDSDDLVIGNDDKSTSSDDSTPTSDDDDLNADLNDLDNVDDSNADVSDKDNNSSNDDTLSDLNNIDNTDNQDDSINLNDISDSENDDSKQTDNTDEDTTINLDNDLNDISDSEQDETNDQPLIPNTSNESTENEDNQMESLMNDNIADHHNDNDQTNAFISASTTTPSFEVSKETNNHNELPVATTNYQDIFDHILQTVIASDPKTYLGELTLKAKDGNEPYIYADPKTEKINLLALTPENVKNDELNEKDAGILEFAISTNQKYGDVQSSITTGSFPQDLAKKLIVLVPNIYSLDVLDSVFDDRKLAVVTVPFDITAKNYDNYVALHLVNNVVTTGGQPEQMSVQEFKEYVDQLREDNKTIGDKKPTNQVVININNPTNLQEIGSQPSESTIGAENEKALKEIIDSYMPKINKMLDNIRVPVFGIDPTKDTDPEVVSNKQIYNDALKSDVAQIKEDIRSKIVNEITESVKNVTDPNKFSQVYPQIDEQLRDKLINQDRINQAIDQRVNKIKENYIVKRRQMIAQGIQEAKDKYQKEELPKRNDEINSAKTTIKEEHENMYRAAINRILASQREQQKPIINAQIENILTSAQADVNRGKDKLKDNTRVYLNELIRTARTSQMINRQLNRMNYSAPTAPQQAAPTQASPQITPQPAIGVENERRYQELQQKLNGLQLANEANNTEKNETIRQLQEQLQAAQQATINAQAEAEQAKARQMALEQERNQYKTTINALKAQSVADTNAVKQHDTQEENNLVSEFQDSLRDVMPNNDADIDLNNNQQPSQPKNNDIDAPSDINF